MNDELLNDYLGKKTNKKMTKFITKILICLIIFFASLIFTKISNKNKELFNSYIFENTFDFMKFNKFYESFTFKRKPVEQTVMGESFTFFNKEKYLDGEKYQLDNGLINNLKTGIVVFSGDKEDFGKTLIIQGENGYDFWYGNLENINVNIYDYVKENILIADAIDNNLYLKIVKDNNVMTYEEYLSQNS